MRNAALSPCCEEVSMASKKTLADKERQDQIVAEARRYQAQREQTTILMHCSWMANIALSKSLTARQRHFTAYIRWQISRRCSAWLVSSCCPSHKRFSRKRRDISLRVDGGR